MRAAMIFSALAVMITSALADEVSAPAKKLTLQECLNIRNALSAFDGYQGVDKDGKSAPMQYKLGTLRKTIALDEAALDRIIQPNDKARLALVKEFLPNGTPPPGTPEYAKFVASDPAFKKFSEKWQEILDSPQSIELGRIRYDDLNVGDAPEKNPIPPDTIAALSLILDF